MNLFEITENIKGLYEQIDNIDEQVLIDTMEGLDCLLEEKAESYIKLIKLFENDIEGIKKESDRLKQLKKTRENEIVRLKKSLEKQLTKIGKKDLKAGLFRIKIQKNAPTLYIETQKHIPKEYYVEQDPKLDQKRLLDDLKNGTEVKGVSVCQSESIRIR